MKVVVWHGVGGLRLDDVPDPKIEQLTGAVIRLIASAICGTDLHFVRGTFTGMKAGIILGHEDIGIIEQLGPMVRNFDVGDRVVVCSTIACGTCSYCRAGYYAQCDNANPNGLSAGTSFFGGPADTGPVNGLQAERARIPPMPRPRWSRCRRKNQVKRLEHVFQMHGQPVKGVDCAAMDGILSEAKEIMGDCDGPKVRDAAMLSAAQAVEHYEITRYGTLVEWARQLGRNDCAAVLQKNLDEEKATDKKLTALAESRINMRAAE